ncbi:R3H domain protein [Oxobacter pfennigii]|uniref:RNA-binding protein KhpB n=2 Tax=Oxobacter pfennigii TaxID=36849 RepID=A0A0N8NST8_9CLOT|nr:R3H domain protein [Oxobacter pfennigii]
MKKMIEATGRSPEDAIKNGLNELNIAREKVDVEIIDEGSRGLFGLLGSKLARVKLTVKKDNIFAAKTFLRDVLDSMDIKAEIKVQEEKDAIKVTLRGPNMGILIGHRGETLDALQYLVSLVVNKDSEGDEYKRVILDTENYRQKREETLVKLANRLAIKVKSTGKNVVLEPMNPYERRVIHSALQDNLYVTTHSEGDEPYRKVVIEAKRK